MMRAIVALLLPLFLCVACATSPRYQLPQTAAGLQASVTAIEQHYQDLYRSFKAGAIRAADMGHVDAIYSAWRAERDLLTDAIQSGAIRLTTE